MGVLKDKFIEQLRLRGYSEKTIKSYTGCVRKLAKYYNTQPTELSKEQIKNFFVYLKNTRKLSPASYNHYHASIKYFYSFFNQEYLMRDIPRTKNHKSKPVVLSKEETIKIIETIANIKHRTIVSLLYSAGLRLSEVINLKITDIDRDRKQIFIRKAKGNKDRYSILSKKSLELIEMHIKANKPFDYLFNSNKNKTGTISSRTIQKVICVAAYNAGIEKKVTPHTLRHSFATHLMEEGVNIRHIQTLLGHANLVSTSIYLHTINLNKLNISSPLDTDS